MYRNTKVTDIIFGEWGREEILGAKQVLQLAADQSSV